MSSDSIESRGVWIFARPLQFGTIFGSQFVNHGKYPFCHWGVLVTSLDFSTAQKNLQEIEDQPNSQFLGTMWELLRDDDGNNNVRDLKFFVRDVKEQWNMFSAEFVGNIEVTDQQMHIESKVFAKHIY